MRESVFKKGLSLLLCGVLLIGALPLHIHAEEVGTEESVAEQTVTEPEAPQSTGLTDEQRYSVVNRQMDGWYFPLSEEFFDDIVDFAGCRGGNENALYGGTNDGCTHWEHAESTYGSYELIVNAGSMQPVYAPVSGVLYRTSQPDQHWGDGVVLEVPVDGNFSYYIVMGSVSADAADSGSYVEAGTTIGYTGGEFRITALMDYSGMGAQIASDISRELELVASYGWLLSGTGTGFVCVNPSAYTTTQYPNALVSDHSGPIVYSFVVSQPEPPTEPVTEPIPTEPVPTETIPTETVPTETIPTETAHTEHVWDEGVMTLAPTHTTNGEMLYTCTICHETRKEPIAPSADHVYDQQVVSDAFLAKAASCANPAAYFYSCLCGAVGFETFTVGEPADHSWDGGVITVQPSHTAGGEVTYTCTVCGSTKTESIPASAEHVFDQEVVSDQYLASPATCDGPAVYYKSCICGQVGTETFTYGEAAEHTYSDQWSYNDTDHWRQATCQHSGEVADYGPHKWDDGEIIQNAGHNVNGEKRYTCTVCGVQKTEVLLGQPHEYNQTVVDQKYLASAATCTSPALYYKSCVCGEAGTETFAYGEAKGHTFSDQWSSNELQHWRGATCEHTDQRVEVNDHNWGPGEITVQPTATSKGVKTYTCVVCGRTKTEEIAPSEHQHTFAATWAGNTTYHWHPATCEHSSVVSGLGEHVWNEGVVTQWASHNTAGQKVFSCTVCGIQKTETIAQTHTYDQMIASSAYLASNATCTSPATYYYSCTCGAKGTQTFTYGSALGHTASGSYGKDANYHWNVCSRCGAKGELVAHSFDSTGKCATCGYSKEDAHIHSSHLSRVPAKAATCTQEGNISYYICDCGQWFSDVTCTSPITDQQSVVLPAQGHVDKDNNGRCDVCKERLDNTVEYQMTEGAETTWLNTSAQGMVFRSNSDYSKFDRVEVDGATVASTNYSVSEGSTIVELNANYLKRLSLGRHTISIVAKDGKASTGFTIKQGASSSGGGNGIWVTILFLAVVIAIAIPVTYGVYYYRKKTGGGGYSR